MPEPLWTNKYAPALTDLHQDHAREYLLDAVNEPINIMFHGPAGVGKTAAARALAEESHSNPDTDLVEINISDLFNQTKKEIREDPRFKPFLQGQTEFSKQFRTDSSNRKYKRNWSKREMASHVLKELAAYAPTDGGYKTIVLDNAEAVREDFQQALRRIMEQHHETTQFIIATRQPSKLIPPIRSRCFPLAFETVGDDDIHDTLRDIIDAEGIYADDDAIDYIVGYADGNLRQAILALQTVSDNGTTNNVTVDETHEELREVGIRSDVRTMLEHADNDEFKDARSILDDLLVDEGHSGESILSELLEVAHAGYYTDTELTEFVKDASDISLALTEANSDRIHLSQLLAAQAN